MRLDTCHGERSTIRWLELGEFSFVVEGGRPPARARLPRGAALPLPARLASQAAPQLVADVVAERQVDPGVGAAVEAG